MCNIAQANQRDELRVQVPSRRAVLVKPFHSINLFISAICPAVRSHSSNQNGTMGSPLVALTEALGLLWLIVGIAYILMWRDPETLSKMQFGIRTLVIISFPVVLFESMFSDFASRSSS